MTNAQLKAADDMRKRLATLSPRQERAMRLRFGIGGEGPLVERDIASKMNISEAEVDELLRNARTHLRR